MILRKNVEINAFEQLKKEAERDYLENKIDAMDDDYLISTIWSQETKAQSLVLSQKMDKKQGKLEGPFEKKATLSLLSNFELLYRDITL